LPKDQPVSLDEGGASLGIDFDIHFSMPTQAETSLNQSA
jgi:hypothetical protein